MKHLSYTIYYIYYYLWRSTEILFFTALYLQDLVTLSAVTVDSHLCPFPIATGPGIGLQPFHQLYNTHEQATLCYFLNHAVASDSLWGVKSTTCVFACFSISDIKQNFHQSLNLKSCLIRKAGEGGLSAIYKLMPNQVISLLALSMWWILVCLVVALAGKYITEMYMLLGMLCK